MSKKSKYIDEDIVYEILKPYAYKVFKDLAKQSRYVIQEFYKNYQPKFYERTYNLRKSTLFNPSIKRTKTGYNVEFVYSVDNLIGDHRSNDDVFETSFVYGWHGGKYAWGHEKQYVPRMIPSPWMSLELFVKSYKI